MKDQILGRVALVFCHTVPRALHHPHQIEGNDHAKQCRRPKRPRRADLRVRSIDSLRSPFGLLSVVYLALLGSASTHNSALPFSIAASAPARVCHPLGKQGPFRREPPAADSEVRAPGGFAAFVAKSSLRSQRGVGRTLRVRSLDSRPHMECADHATLDTLAPESLLR